MKTIARPGDYSHRSLLKLSQHTNGISILCYPNPERRFEEPNPRFYEKCKGGKSPATFDALWQLYNVLPNDHHQRAFIPSKYSDGNQLLVVYSDSIAVKTEDMHGKYGVLVLIGSESPFFKKIELLYRAIKADNHSEPNWNALRSNP